MKVTKDSYKVVITTRGGVTVTADDATTAGAGTGAYQALLQGKDLMIAGATKTFVPFVAIDKADITVTSTTEEVEDANCK